MLQEDTIAAIATPKGVGGIGIIRLSGPRAEEIGRLLFKPGKKTGTYRSHHLYHGDIVSPSTGIALDEVLFTIMRGPHSFTGEDVVEINCHGGPTVMEAILGEVIKAGGRLAEPGEFTKRAFLNNRLDLSQAEAVIDLITAKTGRGLDLAVSHLKGDLSKKIEALRSSLIDLLAHLEISIDFTEEDLEPPSVTALSETIQRVIDDATDFLATYREGKVASVGLSVVITGKPNVGKSSLLNKLLGEERAIITPVPGTTRDFIEGDVFIKGVPVKLIDTAGVRPVDDIIEQEGIRLVWEKVSTADLVMIVLDGSTDLTDEDREVIEKNTLKEIIPVINKTDLPQKLMKSDIDTVLSEGKPRYISAKFGDGIEDLKEEIYGVAIKALQDDTETDVVLTNLRHKIALEKAVACLSKARDNISRGLSPEFAAFDVRESLDALGDIIGETTNEEVLDRIFSTFCVGK
jgi:tRNA modification GTPase